MECRGGVLVGQGSSKGDGFEQGDGLQGPGVRVVEAGWGGPHWAGPGA